MTLKTLKPVEQTLSSEQTALLKSGLGKLQAHRSISPPVKLDQIAKPITSPLTPTVKPEELQQQATEALKSPRLDTPSILPATAVTSNLTRNDIGTRVNSLMDNLSSARERMIKAQTPTDLEQTLRNRIADINSRSYELDSYGSGTGMTQNVADRHSALERRQLGRDRDQTIAELEGLVALRQSQAEIGKTEMQFTRENLSLLQNLSELTTPNVLGTQINKETGEIFAIQQDPMTGGVVTNVVGNIGAEKVKKDYLAQGTYETANGLKFYGVTGDGIEVHDLPGSISSSSGSGGFTLSEGQKRYDANGNLIAGFNDGYSGNLLQVSQKEAADLNKEIANSKQYEIVEGLQDPLNALRDFADYFKKSGVDVLPGESKNTLESKSNVAKLYLKELFNLGVLNGPDLELIEKTLGNVTGLKAALTPGKRDTVNNQLEGLFHIIETSVDRNTATLLNQYKNYDPSQLTNIDTIKGSYIDTKYKLSENNKAIIDGARSDGLGDNEIIELLNDKIDFPEQTNSQLSMGGNLPQRNNNPGNVKSSPLSNQYAAKDAQGRPITDPQGHLVFASPEDGFAALAADINAKISGNSRYLKANPTIAELGSVYAEDPNWPLSVSKILGVDPNTPTQLLPRDELIKAIMRQEGYFA